jgi:hypothetical protein
MRNFDKGCFRIKYIRHFFSSIFICVKSNKKNHWTVKHRKLHADYKFSWLIAIDEETRDKQGLSRTHLNNAVENCDASRGSFAEHM